MARPSYAETRTAEALDAAAGYLAEARRIITPLIVRLDIICNEHGLGNPALRRIASPALEQLAVLHNTLHALGDKLEKVQIELANMRTLKNQGEDK